METAKANKLKSYEYLKHLLTEIPKRMEATSLDFLEDLLPWSENLPEECQKRSEYDSRGSIRSPAIYSVKVHVIERLRQKEKTGFLAIMMCRFLGKTLSSI